MSTHVIAWRNNSTGRAGVGTNRMSLDQAVALSEELNRDHPAFTHVPKPHDAPMPDLAPPPPQEVPIRAPTAQIHKPLTDDHPFPFGPKFKGVRMAEVPSSYLDWIRGQQWIAEWPLVRDYIDRNRKSIIQDIDRKEMSS